MYVCACVGVSVLHQRKSWVDVIIGKVLLLGERNGSAGYIAFALLINIEHATHSAGGGDRGVGVVCDDGM